jgi:hypothetical protein
MVGLVTAACHGQAPGVVSPAELPPEPIPAGPPAVEDLAIPAVLGDECSVADATSGWFARAQLGVVQPSFEGVATSRDGEGTFLGRLRSLDLDWTVSPRLEAGYTFGSGAAASASYRFLSARGGHESTAPADGPYAALGDLPTDSGRFASPDPWLTRDIRGGLDEHWLDLDYSLAEQPVGRMLWCRWFVGARLAALHTQFTARDRLAVHVRDVADPTRDLGSFPLAVEQRATQESFGAGPHLGVDGTCPLGTTGLALVARADAGVVFAANRQGYDVTAGALVTGPGTGGVPVTVSVPARSATERGPGVIPTVNLAAGLDWSAPLGRSCVRITAGYELDAWWFRARGHGAEQNALFTSLSQLSHGPFVRCRLDF